MPNNFGSVRNIAKPRPPHSKLSHFVVLAQFCKRTMSWSVHFREQRSSANKQLHAKCWLNVTFLGTFLAFTVKWITISYLSALKLLCEYRLFTFCEREGLYDDNNFFSSTFGDVFSVHGTFTEPRCTLNSLIWIRSRKKRRVAVELRRAQPSIFGDLARYCIWTATCTIVNFQGPNAWLHLKRDCSIVHFRGPGAFLQMNCCVLNRPSSRTQCNTAYELRRTR